LKSEEINQTSKKKLLKALRKTMSESIQNGDGLEVMKDKLQESARGVFSELSDTRSYLIARTETGASVNMGQVATYQATGIEQKEWIATLDDRTRDSHIAMDGQIADINMTFDVPNETDGGVDAMLYPSDPNGSAGNTCNCRCTIAPVVK
jgi:SPP1 gp7 family putative phage head morphogenesis protein